MPRKLRQSVRLVKKVRLHRGRWGFVPVPRAGRSFIWDRRPGVYFLDWHEEGKRCRETAGVTADEALEAIRRKQLELAGKLIERAGGEVPKEEFVHGTPIQSAVRDFLTHIRVHSPEKPGTHRRYQAVMDHVLKEFSSRRYVEAIQRSHIDTYKATRLDAGASPTTVNFEISTLRTLFNFLREERGLTLSNPCAKFKRLKNPRANQRPSVYRPDELESLFAVAQGGDRLALSILLMTGLREQELCFLTW